MDRRSFIAGAGVAALGSLTGGAPPAHAQPGRLKVLVPALSEEQLAELGSLAPSTDLVVCRSAADAMNHAESADATWGFVSPALVKSARKLKWLQASSAGVEGIVSIPEVVNSDLVVTNMQRAYAPEIADQALGYLLCFTRNLTHFIAARPSEEWQRPSEPVLEELHGKTMLIIALGGIGSHIAQRAHAFGMNVLATDPKVLDRPNCVAELHRPEALPQLLPRADVVVSAVPLTPVTTRMLGSREFGLMKDGVVFINVSRGKIVDTESLVQALQSKKVAAAGLDVTDPEPLPKGHALWKQNVIITPHTAGQSPGGRRRTYEIFRENLRRFAQGEQLINVVDKKAGY